MDFDFENLLNDYENKKLSKEDFTERIKDRLDFLETERKKAYSKRDQVPLPFWVLFELFIPQDILNSISISWKGLEKIIIFLLNSPLSLLSIIIGIIVLVLADSFSQTDLDVPIKNKEKKT